MTTTISTLEALTEFLLARIAEDEAPTYRIVPSAPRRWYVGHECLICRAGVQYGGTPEAITEIAEEHDERIHRRSRVLAECAAKRAILALHQETAFYHPGGPTALCTAGCNGGWPCPTLRALAAAFADHPGYDKAWRP
jgi:Family of unknown function (DUF6221)